MVPLELDRLEKPRSPSPLSKEAAALLNHLRFISMACRSKPRTDLFQACALLHASRSASRDAYADALMRCLGEALGKPARLLAPGTAEMTFDERWLVQLGLAAARRDEASLSFLLGSRVDAQHQRLVRFLITRIAAHFHFT